MIKKGLLLFLSTTILAASVLMLGACGGGADDQTKENKNKLDVALINNPRTAEAPEEQVVQGLATMDFVDTSYNFGKMYVGEVVSYSFEFKNNGGAPLLISNAAGTCGCTVPEYPREPIAPGGTGVIEVKFNSANKVGLQNKTINIFTNSRKGTHSLNIIAEVMEKN